MDSKTAAKPVATGQWAGVGRLLWIVLAAMPWLMPLHTAPWPAFHSEAVAAAVVLPIAIWVLVRGGNAWSLDAASLFLIALAVVPLVQAAAGVYPLAGEGRIVALCLLGLAFTMAVAREAQHLAPLRLADMLFASLAVAALLSAGLALYQWLEQGWLGDLVPFPQVCGARFRQRGATQQSRDLVVLGRGGRLVVLCPRSDSGAHGVPLCSGPADGCRDDEIANRLGRGRNAGWRSAVRAPEVSGRVPMFLRCSRCCWRSR